MNVPATESVAGHSDSQLEVHGDGVRAGGWMLLPKQC